MNSGKLSIAAAAIAFSSGASRNLKEANAHAKFATFCGPKSPMVCITEAEIAPSNCSFRTSSFAQDQAEMARSWPSNSVHLATDMAEIASRSGQSCSLSLANAQTMRESLRVSHSLSRWSTAEARHCSIRWSWICSRAKDQDVVARLYGLNSVMWTSARSRTGASCDRKPAINGNLAARCNAVALLTLSNSLPLRLTSSKSSSLLWAAMISLLRLMLRGDRSKRSCCLSASVLPSVPDELRPP
mmetsp:Transcript_57024/g.101198  ORF Transcript_57024/g.101198 Transcript_57024/m.101198 type:complete len:243 (-) Transcript_57024:217-945(-)